MTNKRRAAGATTLAALWFAPNVSPMAHRMIGHSRCAVRRSRPNLPAAAPTATLYRTRTRNLTRTLNAAVAATNQEIRNPNIEIPNKFEIQNSKSKTSAAGKTAAGGPPADSHQQHAIASSVFPSSFPPFLPDFCHVNLLGILCISHFGSLPQTRAHRARMACTKTLVAFSSQGLLLRNQSAKSGVDP